MLANKLEYLALDEEYVLSMNRPQWTTKSYSIFAPGERKYILKPTHDPAKKLNRGAQGAWTFSPSHHGRALSTEPRFHENLSSCSVEI